MLDCYRENRIAQQASYRTPFGAATGEPSRGQAYEHQRPEAIFHDRGCLGTLAVAAMPIAQDPLAAGTRALPLGAGAATFGDAAGACRTDRQHSIFTEHGAGGEGPRLGLGARATQSTAVRRRQSALLYVGKRPAGVAGSGPAAGSGKRAPLGALSEYSTGPRPRLQGRGAPDSAILESCSDANVAELVDAPDLGSGGVTRASSSLAFRTS